MGVTLKVCGGFGGEHPCSTVFQYYRLLAFIGFARRCGCFSAGVLLNFGASFRWIVFG